MYAKQLPIKTAKNCSFEAQCLTLPGFSMFSTQRFFLAELWDGSQLISWTVMLKERQQRDRSVDEDDFVFQWPAWASHPSIIAPILHHESTVKPFKLPRFLKMKGLNDCPKIAQVSFGFIEEHEVVNDDEDVPLVSRQDCF